MRFVPYESNGRSLIAPEDLCSVGPSVPIGKIHVFDPLPVDPEFSFDKELQQTLEGKELLLDELSFSTETLHDHYLHGYLAYSSGILHKDGKYACQRCGNEVQRLFAKFSCARCRETCVYCRKCVMMGRVSVCTPLLNWCGPRTEYGKRPPLSAWQGELSSGQEHASEAVVAAVGKGKELLVWAVCGAGKTEVLFAGIETALQEGQRICVASPRTDVIVELAPRFREAFPKVEQVVLYGGSKDRGKQGQMVLATTHQLQRFREAFDFVVIDEVDAFPFDSDETLAYAVNKARRSTATTVYLTATPDQKIKTRLQNKELSAVKIPLRYHGHPLPSPKFIWSGNWDKRLRRHKVPAVVSEWAACHCAKERQAFLFVPSITVMKQVTSLLQPIDARIESVHADDEHRREKVDRFRNGKTPVLVTTTILERGVTVADIDVAVFGADHDVFTERALVQMAGRVGRSAKAPEGEVCFFHYGKTNAMVDARKHIESMNDAAFLGEGW